MARVIQLYDTTLRDGTQAENFNLSVDDKIKVCRQLDRIGIDFIEGGWPGSNPLAVTFFDRMQSVELKHAKLTAFGSTRHFQKKPEADSNLQALLAAKTPAITIFGKSWDIHVIDALRIELEDNLQIIEDSLAYLRPRVRHLIYDAEHFFDGFKNNREYCLATIGKAIAGGAETVVLCDTNGGTLPHEIPEIMQRVQQYCSEQGARAIRIGIHAHNDSETAVANALMSVHLGANHVQGTINGFGERCGNANLTSIIPALIFKMGLECKVGKRIDQLYTTARMVNELANLPHNRYQPYVGESAFAHKGGVHISAVQRNPMTYEHIAPEKVGNIRRVLVSDQSGKANILLKAQKYGLNISQDDPMVTSIVAELKQLENLGYQFEAAEASFELLMRRTMGLHRDFFQLETFRVIHHTFDEQNPVTEATIRLYVGGKEVHTASMGDGPVNALDRALRKALTRFYPELEDMELVDYKVRVLTGEHGTGAKVRVLVETKDLEKSWGTVGVSVNIIEASWQALVDSINYKLIKDEKNNN